MNIKEFIKENQNYFEDFITRATHHSNGIEGNTLSMAETYAIIFNRNDVRINVEPREFYESINHKYALDYIFNNMEEQLIEKNIVDIAKLINKNINDIGGYRTTQVFIQGAEHIPPAANTISQIMMYFISNYNNTIYDDIFQKVAKNHIEFERIHPFSDGNGRTGRLLMCYEFLKNNIAPPIITKGDKINYIKFIENQDAEGLSEFLKELSEKENLRINVFRELEVEHLLKNELNEELER